MYACVTSWDMILKFSAVGRVLMRRFLYLLVFKLWTRYSVSLSLWPWKMHFLCIVQIVCRSFNCMMIRLPSIFELDEMCFSSTNDNDFLSNRPSISCLIASWILVDEYLGSDFRNSSVRNMSV